MKFEGWQHSKRTTEASRSEVEPTASEKPRTFGWKQTSLVLGIIGALAAGGSEIDHQLTRHKVIEHINKKGEVVYEHEDQETTHILNYIAGKDHMTDKDRVWVFRDSTRKRLEGVHMRVPSDFETMGGKELKELEVSVLNTYEKGGNENFVDEEFRDIFPNYTYNPDLYTKLWKLEEHVGAPKIRWSLNTSDLNRNASYDSSENTIYMKPDMDPGHSFPNQDLEKVIAEASHAEQWEQNHWYYDVRNLYDSVVTNIRMAEMHENSDDAQSNQYITPGSIEYDAHHIRQERLEKPFENAQPEISEPKKEHIRYPE